MALVFRYINFRHNHDARLAFEALKYLSALLCHKKFTLEFLSGGGLEVGVAGSVAVCGGLWGSVAVCEVWRGV